MDFKNHGILQALLQTRKRAATVRVVGGQVRVASSKLSSAAGIAVGTVDSDISYLARR